MQRHIIVTGIPASGKSTIGQAVAAALGLAMFDKDEILEALFNSRGVGNADWRRELSRAADDELKEKALRSEGAVISSWWHHPASNVDTGTPVEWLSSFPGVVVELHCVCSPHIAAERFRSRTRHEGHLDHLKTHAELLASFEQQAALGPLGLGRLVEVKTERNVDLEPVLAQIDIASTTAQPMREASQPLRMTNGQIVICPDEILGPRLVLKPIAAEYATEIFQEFTPEITTYMMPRSPSHISETEQFIAEAFKQREAGTDLGFVILDKQSSEFLGMCGLHGTQDPRQPEFGIWLKKAAHGKGLGREAISVLKAWCERTLAIDAFIYPVDRRNRPSRKIPEALGAKVVSEKKEANMSGGELDELVYLIPLSPTTDSRG